ncbi:unnamed protein product, partial [Amoebophrya sp. A120]
VRAVVCPRASGQRVRKIIPNTTGAQQNRSLRAPVAQAGRGLRRGEPGPRSPEPTCPARQPLSANGLANSSMAGPVQMFALAPLIYLPGGISTASSAP